MHYINTMRHCLVVLVILYMSKIQRIQGQNCGSDPCQNGGMCTEVEGSYSCNCPAFYDGDNCEITPCQDLNCTSEQTCVLIGDDGQHICQDIVDPCDGIICAENAECLSGLCRCIAGFEPNSHGICEETTTASPTTTTTTPTTTTTTSAAPVDPCADVQCEDNAECKSLPGQSQGQCQCIEGFELNINTGICEEAATTTPSGYTDPCASGPCKNGATCIDIGDNAYECQCASGFDGADCSEDKDECATVETCHYWANCTNTYGSYICECQPGFLGDGIMSCDDSCKVREVSERLACEGANQAECESVGCCWDDSVQDAPFCFDKYSAGYTDPCASSPCKNGGTCIDIGDNAYECQCASGFDGADCSEDLCKVIEPTDRLNCGYEDVTQSSCESLGCCWDNGIRNVPWCFLKDPATGPPPTRECQKASANRVDCALNIADIAESLCIARGCCYGPAVQSLPVCYYTEDRVPTTTTSTPTTTTSTVTTTTTPDPCASHTCEVNSVCYNDNGTATCVCESGFAIDPDNDNKCKEQCGQVFCDKHADCHQETCFCNSTQGYEADPDDSTKCISMCDPGEYYLLETLECLPCEKGTYWLASKGPVCHDCPNGKTTKQKGSIGKSSCIDICDKGSFSNNQGTCIKCHIGFYKPATGVQPCTKCQEGYTTAMRGSTSNDSCVLQCETESDFCGSNGTCTQVDNMGTCVCDMGYIGDRCQYLDPILLKIEPNYGPIAGGTPITMTGVNLDFTTLQFVRLGNQPCVIDRETGNDTLVLCLSKKRGVAVDVNQIKMEWTTGLSKIFNFTYRYRPDPTIENIPILDTILSGGIHANVIGDNLDSVRHSYLQLQLLYGENPVYVSDSPCTDVRKSRMVCPFPKVLLSNELRTELGLPQLQTKRRRRRELQNPPVEPILTSHSKTRNRRQTEEANKPINERTVAEFAVLVRFDGLQVNYTEDVDEYANVYADPDVERFDEDMFFRPFWPFSDKSFNIKTKGIPGSLFREVHVLVGESTCDKTEVHSNDILCHPPQRQPEKGSDSRGLSVVLVQIGHLESDVGYMAYQHNIWEYPPGRTGILAGSAGLILLIIIIVICIKCRKPRRKKSRPPPYTTIDQHSRPSLHRRHRRHSRHSTGRDSNNSALSMHSVKFDTATRYNAHPSHNMQGSVHSSISSKYIRGSARENVGNGIPADHLI